MTSHDACGEDLYVSIPHGGPIYFPDMIGPLTRVPDFECSVFQELRSLGDEISGDYVDIVDGDISLDELKIVQEEDLVARAFEEAFKAGELALDGPQATEACSIPRDSVDKVSPGSEHDFASKTENDLWAIVPSESADVLPLKTCLSEKPDKKSSSSRKRRKLGMKRDECLDENYMEKVTELSIIKRKQEEDKKAVRLHSFNGSSKNPVVGAAPKTEVNRYLRSASVPKKVIASSTLDHVPVQFPEAVFCLEVYHSRKLWLKTQEFLILGRQFLTEVKDKISCVTDEMMKKEGVYDPSGYFLIEDCFCNDTRAPGASDYSKPILDWLENSKNEALEKWEYITSGGLQEKQRELFGVNRKSQLPRFRSVRMQNTRLCDLRFRLGAGYLYCHQGECRHLIVLRDMRLIHPEDVQNRVAYPLVTFQAKIRHRKCSVCKIYLAKKVTVDDKWAASNPCYFCDVCYYMLHYANGSLLYTDFSVYEYHRE